MNRFFARTHTGKGEQYIGQGDHKDRPYGGFDPYVLPILAPKVVPEVTVPPTHVGSCRYASNMSRDYIMIQREEEKCTVLRAIRRRDWVGQAGTLYVLLKFSKYEEVWACFSSMPGAQTTVERIA